MLLRVLRYLPNTLTVLRLLLAVPICYLIYQQQFAQVLWLSLFAGLSDGLDGFLARALNAQTRFGSVVDPLSDKILLVGSYVSFALVGLVPTWLTAVVIFRDVLIVAGATAYYRVVGHLEMQPSRWGKSSTLVQIAFALILIANQVWHFADQTALNVGIAAVALLAVISGSHYVYVWSRKVSAEKIRVKTFTRH